MPLEETVKQYLTVQSEGSRRVERLLDHYSLDVVIAVGYRVRTMYLDYAEDQAMRQRPMHMADWVTKLDGFLEFNERNILTHALPCRGVEVNTCESI